MNLNAPSRDHSSAIPWRGTAAGTELGDDAALVRRVAGGDEHAFALLYRGHGTPLYNYILRLVRDTAVAENVLQDVFVAVWQGAGGFRGGAQVRTWLFRIAHHRAVSWLRRERAAGEGPAGDDVERGDAGDGIAAASAEDDGSGPEARAMAAWDAGRIRDALDGLSPDHRAVVELVFFHGLSYAEVAEVAGCPVGTVKSRMSWARRYLAGALRNLDHDR